VRDLPAVVVLGYLGELTRLVAPLELLRVEQVVGDEQEWSRDERGRGGAPQKPRRSRLNLSVVRSSSPVSSR
jgi:hypothetical protein